MATRPIAPEAHHHHASALHADHAIEERKSWVNGPVQLPTSYPRGIPSANFRISGMLCSLSFPSGMTGNIALRLLLAIAVSVSRR